jgi:DNA helicase-2/ATP-dependent DNA helicase PcrA
MDLNSPDSENRDLLERLTPSQVEAVRHRDGPLLILAGPGSGKTRVVTHRIAFLLRQGIPAWQILALTFTNKAAEEMKLRLAQLAPGEAVWTGTFHRFCARLLRQHAQLVGLEENYSIYDTIDSRKLLRSAIDDTEINLSHVTVDQIANEISNAKNNLVTASQFVSRAGQTLGGIVEVAYPAYQKRMLQANAVDFDDLLLHLATMLRENPELRQKLDNRYRYIMVDEYQDTNFSQYAIVRALSRDHPNLAVTGDPDQSIYGWRGANLRNILDFEHDFPHVCVVRLEQNYRSTPNILQVADQLIAYNTQRKPKQLLTENPPGKPVRLIRYPSSRDEAEHIVAQIADDVAHDRRRPRDFALFYRVNSLSRALESAFRNSSIPYQIIKGLEFYQRKEIKDVLAYLHLINNPRSDMSLLRIINVPPRRIGNTTIKRLDQHAQRYGISLLEAAREAKMIESLRKPAIVALSQFVQMLDALSPLAVAPLSELMEQVLSDSGYRQWLEESESDEETGRLGNVEELLTDAVEFDAQYQDDAPLEAFLEQTALVSDTDAWEGEIDKVSLMTLHAAKGLEFPCVFIVAVEQGLLPHNRSLEDPDQLEEERRLLFVGITRAEEELQLSNAAYRFIRGNQELAIPSQFLMELPREEMEVFEPTSSPHVNETWDDYADADEDDHYVQDVVDDELGEPDSKDPLMDEAIQHEFDQQPATRPVVASVMTAAQLLADALDADSETNRRSTISPADFVEGMVVKHPKYGLGKIEKLSGKENRRTASVQFFNSPRVRQYVLAFSSLVPVQSADG